METAHGSVSHAKRASSGWRRAGGSIDTTVEAMHHGHREAALGNRRLQVRQVRLERDILMSRSIDAAPSTPQE
jgi:hypothetical protein